MSLHNIIEAASFTPRSLLPPNAWVGHLPFAAWVIQQVCPEIFVELGTHSGNSYFSFCQSVAQNKIPTRCYAVDTWQGDEHAGEYEERIFKGVDAHNQALYAQFSRLMRMTFDEAVSFFSNESIGLLHIDGLHTYDAVRHDFETWLPKLAPDAIVMFHDTNVRELNFGVWQLWEELKQEYSCHMEFTHSNGLGVLQLNHASEEKKQAWLEPGAGEKQELRRYFAALGTFQLGRFGQRELEKTVAERGTRIVALQKTVLEMENQTQKCIAQHNAQILEYHNEIAEKEEQIAQILNSSSWKATRLLRQMGRLKAGMTDRAENNLESPDQEAGEAVICEQLLKIDLDMARPMETDYSACVPFGFEIPPQSNTGRVAAVIHLFYEDLAVEIRSYMANVPVNMDIFISTTDEFKASAIECVFNGWDKGLVEVRISPNRGRDIAPKLVTFKDVYAEYDYVLFIHGKQSPHESFLFHWRHFLLESLLGSPGIVKNILHTFSLCPDLGMIAAQHFEPVRNAINWGGNFQAAQNLAGKMGFALNPEDPLDFPSGSMFWARTSALKPLLDLKLTHQDFEAESNQVNGTLAHACERLFFFVCEHQNLKWMKIAHPPLYTFTPMIVEIKYGADLTTFLDQHLFSLLNPKGVKPRSLTPEAIKHPAPYLPGHIQNRILGTHLMPGSGTRVAIGLVARDNSLAELTGAIHAAKIALTSAGFKTENALFLTDINAQTRDGIEIRDGICKMGGINSFKAEDIDGSGSGHNFLMKAAFEAGNEIYIAIDPRGHLHPGAVKALVQMVQAAHGKVLVDALQFPRPHFKSHDPQTFDTPWVCGRCVAMSKETFNDLGGFDEQFSLYWEDVDLSWRARAHGYQVKTCSRALFLDQSLKITPKQERMMLNQGILLARKWGSEEWENRLKKALTDGGSPVPEQRPDPVPRSWQHLTDFSKLEF